MRVLVSRKKRRSLFIGVGVFVALGLLVSAGLVISHLVVAANSLVGPDPSWFGGNHERYALENDSNVIGAGKSQIPVYVLNTNATPSPPTHPPTNVTIYASSFTKGYSGSTLSSVSFTYPSGSSCTATATAYADSGTPSFTIPSACLTYQASIDGWTTTVTANLHGNSGSIQFYLNFSAPTDGSAVFGYSANNSAQSFAVAPQYRCDPSGGSQAGCNDYYNFSLPFGTDCSVTNSKPAVITIYDGDNPSGSAPYGVQPVAFTVGLYDYTNGSAVAVSTTAAGSFGNNGTRTYTFTAQPGHKYRFELKHVYTNNTLQFRLPYDSINYQTDCHAYNLAPSVSIPGQGAAQPGQAVSVTPGVDNPNGPGASSGTYWEVTSMVYPSSVTVPTSVGVTDNGGVATVNPAKPCQYYAGTGATGCVIAKDANGNSWTGTGSFSVGAPSTYSGNGNFIAQTLALASNYPAGSHVCFALSVYSYNDTTGTNQRWANSVPACILVGWSPEAQIQGGDLRSDGGVLGSTVVDGSGDTFGSWVEYGIFAVKSIRGVGSGAAYAGPSGLAGATVCTENQLSFTLDASDTSCTATSTFGGYSSGQPFTNIAANFPVTSTTPTFSSLADAAHQRVETASGNVSIGAGTIGANQWLVLNAPNSTVTITGNITDANGPFTSIGQIPQLVIIAKKIVIDAGVTNVDAWLIAHDSTNNSGEIDTCDTQPPLTTATCNKQLTIHGPVVTDTLNLWRTYVAGNGVPAEIIDLRADAYLWAYAQATASGHAQVMYTQELSPRL